jgi:hypothetical protein
MKVKISLYFSYNCIVLLVLVHMSFSTEGSHFLHAIFVSIP